MDKKKGCRKLVLVASTVISIIVFVISMGIYNSPVHRISRQIDLGQKYLVEQDYEQAVIAFDKAIAIDPMNADAYLGKTDAYIGMGDYAQAIETYKAALENAKNASDIERIKDAAEQAYLDYANSYVNCTPNATADTILAQYDTALSILQEGYDLLGRESLRKRMEEIGQLKVQAEAAKAEAEAKKLEEEIMEWVETDEFQNISSACIWHWQFPFLSDAYFVELAKPTVDFLEEYRDMWMNMENEHIVWACGYCLLNYYLSTGELDKCLEVRRQVYEKTGSEHMNPMGRTEKDGNNQINYDEYGREVVYKQEETNGSRTTVTIIYGSNGRKTEEVQTWAHMSSFGGSRDFCCYSTMTTQYQYDSFGRIERETRRIICEGKCNLPEDSTSTTTYTYSDDGFSVHEEFESNVCGEILHSYRDYTVDAYGEPDYY